LWIRCLLAAFLDGVAVRPLEDILKHSMSANYVYDFSRVLLGHSIEFVYLPIIGLLGECHLYFHQNGHLHIILLVAHEHNTWNAFLWVQTLFCDTDDCICKSVNCSIGAKYLLHRSFCLYCHIVRLCHVKMLWGIPDGNRTSCVWAFLQEQVL